MHFDLKFAAVVSILLGLFQLLLAIPLYYIDVSLPRNLFLLPVATGCLIVASGSCSVACAKAPTRKLRRGCAYSNVAVLLGALLALGLYGYLLRTVDKPVDCETPMTSSSDYHLPGVEHCAEDHLMNMFCAVIVLLMIYDVCGALLHGALSVTSLRALRQAS